jgi:lipoate-protein ligase A
LRLNTEGNRISGPVIYSDAMDGEMIASLAGVLNGTPLNWNEMANAVRKGFPESPEMKNVADWLEEAPIGRKEEVQE